MMVGGPAATADPPVDVKSVVPSPHETQPPARFTEASLIKKLEEEGIGRPSTYAAVIATIQSREYVVKKSGSLLPSYIGIAVTHLLREHFNKYVDLEFTAHMEEDLDRIAAGEVDWVEFLDCFYRGAAARARPAWNRTSTQELEQIDFPAHRGGHRTRRPASPSSCASGATTCRCMVEGEDDRARHPAGGPAHRRIDAGKGARPDQTA